MIDPSTPDLSGRVLEALGRLGLASNTRRSADARPTSERRKPMEGSPMGSQLRVRHLAGDHRAGRGRSAGGRSSRRGRRQLAACPPATQRRLGESPDTYADPGARGQGPVTASQTAWAFGLLAAGMEGHPAVMRASGSLSSGRDPTAGGTNRSSPARVFPRRFYLRYHYYPLYFPLIALSRFAVSPP